MNWTVAALVYLLANLFAFVVVIEHNPDKYGAVGRSPLANAVMCTTILVFVFIPFFLVDECRSYWDSHELKRNWLGRLNFKLRSKHILKNLQHHEFQSYIDSEKGLIARKLNQGQYLFAEQVDRHLTMVLNWYRKHKPEMLQS